MTTAGAAIRRGEEEAFRRVAEPHRRELHVHCYRMLGSLHEAEDVVQETLFRAWRRLETFEARAPFRAWLYGIATNACLDVLRQRRRRLLPDTYGPPSDPTAPPAPPLDVEWLEPYPDALLEADPVARYERRETVRLAFVAALQLLPPTQRAAFLLRDVLGWSARESADALGTTPAAVHSALQRTRTRLDELPPSEAADAALEATVVDRYVRAWESSDVDGLVALLKEDAVMTMPPTPSWYRGREAVGAYFATLFAGEWGPRLRDGLVPTRANGQAALAAYADDGSGVRSAFALKVLTLSGSEISVISGFADPTLFPLFGLPSRA